MLDKDYFKPIPGYPGYYASQYGEIWSEATGRILKENQISKARGGYCVVGIKDSATGKYRPVSVHRLVALVYCEKKPGQNEVHHINKNRTDNRADNLMWVSRKEHMKSHRKESFDYDSPEAINICLNCPKKECTPGGCKYLLATKRKR